MSFRTSLESTIHKLDANYAYPVVPVYRFVFAAQFQWFMHLRWPLRTPMQVCHDPVEN